MDNRELWDAHGTNKPEDDGSILRAWLVVIGTVMMLVTTIYLYI